MPFQDLTSSRTRKERRLLGATPAPLRYWSHVWFGEQWHFTNPTDLGANRTPSARCADLPSWRAACLRTYAAANFDGTSASFDEPFRESSAIPEPMEAQMTIAVISRLLTTKEAADLL